MKASELIINKPDELSHLRRWGDFTATVFFWALIFYLWQPLISVIAWAFGVKLFYEHMIVLGGSEKLLTIIGIYAIYVIAFGGALILWALSNRWRFKDKCKRKEPQRVTSDMVASHYMLKPKVHDKIRNARNVSLWISDEFEISSRVNEVETDTEAAQRVEQESEESPPQLLDNDSMAEDNPDKVNGNIRSDI